MEYDAPPIVVHSRYTYEEYNEFSAFCLYKTKHYKALNTFVLILVPVMIAVIFFCDPDSFSRTMGWILLALYPFYLASLFLIPKIGYQQMLKLVSGGVTFTFENDEIHIDTLSGGAYKENAVMRYELLVKIYETPTMFYLFIPGTNAYLVSKRGFLSGSPEELRSLLAGKIGSKQYKHRY